MKRILITGGAGFVGRHFVKRFLDNGDEVVCIDNIKEFTGGIDPDSGWPLYNPKDYNNFHFFKEDCRKYFELNQNSYFDYAFHLAAIVGGRLMIENNPLAVADDLSIDAAYWQWAKEAKPGKTICFSSSAAYPINMQRENDYVLLKEDVIDFNSNLGQPDMSYGWAKLTHEYLAKLAFEKHNIKSVVYRPFSGYGEDQDDSYPFPGICKRAIEMIGSDELMVWGSGKQKRDFIHIEDCVDGVLSTMDKIDDGEALNLSTGIYTDFIEFATMAADACGYNPVVKGMVDKPTGVFARGGDTAKQKKFGFQHKTKFKDGIKSAILYYEKNLK